MPIQFCCTQCGQPIEVDDEHGGQTAACPYCRHLVTIPPESTYQPQGAVPARPAAPPGRPAAENGSLHPPTPSQVTSPTSPPAPFVSYGDGDSLPDRRAARTLGNYALVCTILVFVLFAVGMVRGALILVNAGAFTPTFQPTPEQTDELRMRITTDPWVVGTQFGAMFFALVGLALAIASLVRHRHQNWRAVVGLAACGLFLLCLCGVNLISLIGQMPGIGAAVAG